MNITYTKINSSCVLYLYKLIIHLYKFSINSTTCNDEKPIKSTTGKQGLETFMPYVLAIKCRYRCVQFLLQP